MAGVNELARSRGVLTLWDCSHAAGAVTVDLAGRRRFAVGCAKYSAAVRRPGVVLRASATSRARLARDCRLMGHAVSGVRADLRAAGGAAAPPDGTPGIIRTRRWLRRWTSGATKREDPWKTLAVRVTIALLEQECGKFGVNVTSPRKYDEQGTHRSAIPVPIGLRSALEHGVVSSFRSRTVRWHSAGGDQPRGRLVAGPPSRARDRGLARAPVKGSVSGASLDAARPAADIAAHSPTWSSRAPRDSAKVDHGASAASLTDPALAVGLPPEVRSRPRHDPTMERLIERAPEPRSSPPREPTSSRWANEKRFGNDAHGAPPPLVPGRCATVPGPTAAGASCAISTYAVRAVG